MDVTSIRTKTAFSAVSSSIDRPAWFFVACANTAAARVAPACGSAHRTLHRGRIAEGMADGESSDGLLGRLVLNGRIECQARQKRADDARQLDEIR
jgi:hypothetical protein